LALGKESEENGDKGGIFYHAPLREKRGPRDCDLWVGNEFKWPTKMLTSAKKTKMTPLIISTQIFSFDFPT